MVSIDTVDASGLVYQFFTLEQNFKTSSNLNIFYLDKNKIEH